MHLLFQMGYMTVEEHSGHLLHLKRSPGIRSWSVLVGKIAHRHNQSSFLSDASSVSSTLSQSCVANRCSVHWVGGRVLQLRCSDWLYTIQTQPPLYVVFCKRLFTPMSVWCRRVWFTQTASSGSSSTWRAVYLWPCRTWRIGKRLCLTKPRTGLSSKPSACTLWSWPCGPKGKRKVCWRRGFARLLCCWNVTF